MMAQEEQFKVESIQHNTLALTHTSQSTQQLLLAFLHRALLAPRHLLVGALPLLGTLRLRVRLQPTGRLHLRAAESQTITNSAKSSCSAMRRFNSNWHYFVRTYG